MKALGLFLFFSIITSYSCFVNCKLQSNSHTQLFSILSIMEKLFTQPLAKSNAIVEDIQRARQYGKLQDEISPLIPFPCNVTGFRSPIRPTSVHKLRPGDIDVIGAIGDSLTAGNGLLATRLLEVSIQNRGLVWSIGGQETWRKYLTLPNILKEFNPNIFGYSLNDSSENDKASQFNPSEAGVTSSELPRMAKVLIARIKHDPRVDLQRDWKLVTIFIGGNDFCLDICEQQNLKSYFKELKKNMMQTFRLLRDNLPRTIVNMVLPLDFQIMSETKNTPELCKLIRRMACHCLFSSQFKDKKEKFIKYIKRWQKMDTRIAKLPEFHTNDFEIVTQPFISDGRLPLLSPEQTDFSYMSADCFHISQKMGARAANSLWNNMLQPIGAKTIGMPPLFQTFLCPTEEHPYIFTTKNSQPNWKEE